MSSQAIAKHLNIVQSEVLRIEEWANCLFVVVKGLGARFVSKKVMEEIKLPNLKGTEKQVKWASDIRIQTVRRLDIMVDHFSTRYAKKDREAVAEEVRKYFIDLIESSDQAAWWIENNSHIWINLDYLIVECSWKARPHKKFVSSLNRKYKLEAIF